MTRQLPRTAANILTSLRVDGSDTDMAIQGGVRQWVAHNSPNNTGAPMKPCFREYKSSTRTVECLVPIDNPDEEIFSLRHLRELVAATADYDEECFVAVMRPVACEDHPGRFWVDGIAIEETSPGTQRDLWADRDQSNDPAEANEPNESDG